MSDIEQRLREAMDGVTPGPWVAKQTVIHGNEYGGWWLEGIDLDPEDATRPERLVLISGSGGARSYTTRIIDRQIHDDNEANMKWFALCSPDNIGALLDERAADRATIASLRSKLEEAEGALEPFASLIDALDRVPDAAEIAALPSAKIDQVLSLKVGDLRRARRALQAVGPEPAVADENRRLRAVISKVCEALPNGAFCSPNCTIEFMEEVPSEVASVISALVATPPAEPVVEEWREIEQHVQPRLADGYTAVAISKPGFWMVKGPGPAAALATKPAVKDDETMVETLRELLGFARALEKQGSKGTGGRRGGAIFAKAEAALAAKDGRS